MTTAEYLQTPETLLPTELAYGVLRVADAPTVGHQRIVGSLFIQLHQHVRERELGEVLLAPIDVILDDERALVVQPDLVYVSSGRAAIVGERLRGAPDLAIEVLSPRPRVGDIEQRIGWFARYGVRECWLVSLPARQVTVLTLTPDGVSHRILCPFGSPIRSRVLPDFRETPAL